MNSIIGTPSAVQLLELTHRQGSNISLNWTASLPIGVFDLDSRVTYCVHVINSNTSATLHTECGINVTVFTYPLSEINLGCDSIHFTVIPVNPAYSGEMSAVHFNVEGKKNMIPASILC